MDEKIRSLRSEALNQCCVANRPSGKQAIKDIMARLRFRVEGLQRLHDMLPEKPTPEQDESLWQIVIALEK